jgi:hypothetical protein
MCTWPRLFTFTLLFLFMTTASMADTASIGEGNDQWHKRSGSTEPGTKDEKMAMELIRKREQVMKLGPYTVQIDGNRGEYTQVSVRLHGGEGDVDTVRRFLVKDGLLVAYADPVYEQAPKKFDQARMSNALMIARQTKAGEAPNRPDIYNGFAYTAEIDGCMATVTEKNSYYEVVETYEFDLCH